jgi:16S rRNA (guanine527-N7)-methyltransferase
VTSLEFRDKLARRSRRASAPISVAMLEPLEAYFRLLAQWNVKINLTALPLDPPTDETFDRLLVEPLVAARWLSGGSPIGLALPAANSSRVPSPPARAMWIDVGSGGGSPALPLKIARPALELVMIESKERKSAFLREAIRVLGLAGATVRTERFEAVARSDEHQGVADFVTVRAVRADPDLFETAGKILKEGGQLLLFKEAHSPTADPPGLKRVKTVPLIDTPRSFLCIYSRVFHVEQR